MAHFQRVVLVLGVLAAVGAEPEPQRNEYLPPKKGYDYPKPNIPFPSGPPTQYRPPPQQTPSQPSYRPPPTPTRPPTYNTPAPVVPSYRPPPSTYGPPQDTYRPPPPPPPTYGPPQDTYRPPPPTSPPVRPPPARPPPPRPPTTYPSGPVGDHSHDHGHGTDHVHEPGMPYDFNYAVRADETGVDFSQNEVSDGDQVKGEYRVQLPDGRLQIVRYTADWKTGFHADVTYEGEAKYPDFVPNAANNNQVIADRPNSGYTYPRPGQANPPNSYAPPSTGGPY